MGFFYSILSALNFFSFFFSFSVILTNDSHQPGPFFLYIFFSPRLFLHRIIRKNLFFLIVVSLDILVVVSEWVGKR
ncbi:hypothetical protein EV426DRAFT_201538 [Tirmania nivea]|nr:hypothetical protein EV426DRAFT_201538 [Tirmania nivea]